MLSLVKNIKYNIVYTLSLFTLKFNLAETVNASSTPKIEVVPLKDTF